MERVTAARSGAGAVAALAEPAQSFGDGSDPHRLRTVRAPPLIGVFPVDHVEPSAPVTGDARHGCLRMGRGFWWAADPMDDWGQGRCSLCNRISISRLTPRSFLRIFSTCA